MGREIVGLLSRYGVVVSIGYWAFEASYQSSTYLLGHTVFLGLEFFNKTDIALQAASLGHELLHVLQRLTGDIPEGRTTTKQAERIAYTAGEAIRYEISGRPLQSAGERDAFRDRLDPTNGINTSYRWLEAFGGTVGETYRNADPGTTHAGMVALIFLGMGFSQDAVKSVFDAAK
jgi:hypothetical protein